MTVELVRGSAASYSLTLRPDVSIALERGSRRSRVFLDAKYRVDGFSKAFIGDQDPDEGLGEPEGTFKPDDLYKMHTYRDAVGGAFAAVAVYPGSERRLYPPVRDDFIARGGVGAVPLRPRVSYNREAYASEVRGLVEAAWSSLGASEP